jgi:large subunit ribosomal protein L9
MKVLLTQDLHKLGRAGEVKKVTDGYARNYLIPQGIAIPATPAALKKVEDIKRRVAKEQERMAAEMAGLAGRIGGMTLVFHARAAESGKLYGSVTPHDIVKALAEATGVEIDRRKVEAEPLRELGQHPVKIRLGADIEPEVIVYIVREGEEAPAPIPTEAAAPADETLALDEAPTPEEEALEMPEEITS